MDKQPLNAMHNKPMMPDVQDINLNEVLNNDLNSPGLFAYSAVYFTTPLLMEEVETPQSMLMKF